MRYALSPTARSELAEIYHFSLTRWGEAQADRYVGGLFALFERIGENGARSRPIADADVAGRQSTFRKHFVYWQRLNSGRALIVTILHQHMVQADRVRVAFDALGQAHPSST